MVWDSVWVREFGEQTVPIPVTFADVNQTLPEIGAVAAGEDSRG